MYDNDADKIVDEIDRLIAWHAPVAHLADSVPVSPPQSATVDLEAMETPAVTAGRR